MKIRNIKFQIIDFFLVLIIIFTCFTCKWQNNSLAEYHLKAIDKNEEIALTKWNILGLVQCPDSIKSDFLNYDHLLPLVSEDEFVKAPYVFRSKDVRKTLGASLNGKVQRAEGSIMYSKKLNKIDSTSVGNAIYYYCKLNSGLEQEVFLFARSTGGIKVWLNGESIYISAEEWRYEVSYKDFIKLKLREGENILVVKMATINNDVEETYYECKLTTRKNIIDAYKISNPILFYSPIFESDIILRQNHASIIDTSVYFNFFDTIGERLFQTILKKNSTLYINSDILPRNHAYLCQAIVDGQYMTQPIYKGNPDTIAEIFKNKLQLFSNESSIYQYNNPLIYRLNELLIHPSRKTDWYWPIKVANLIFEIELNYNAHNNKQLRNNLSFGILLKEYKSKLDSTPQHYMLITPDSLKENKKYPLVVVIKPNSENKHHFLTSPQVAYYWALLLAKNLANKYQYFVLLPSARLYESEDLVPMVESEIINAIEDVKLNYHVDPDKIYLHGNCTGGYRALKFACHFPDKFAAIALYAPTTQNSEKFKWIQDNNPLNLIKNISNTPIYLQYDPYDDHIPVSAFKPLIKKNIKRTNDVNVSIKYHSGLFYNILLVGEEAFQFFENKKLNKHPQKVHLKFSNMYYNSSYWIKCIPANSNERTELNCQYNGKENTIEIKGENIGKAMIDTNNILIDKEKPLHISINNSIVYNEKPTNKSIDIDFKDIEKSGNNNIVIADLFYKPFIIVYNDKNNSESYGSFVEDIKHEYEEMLFSTCPLKKESEIDKKDLYEKNLFLLGDSFNTDQINRAIEELNIKNFCDSISKYKKHSGRKYMFQSIYTSPFNKENLIVVYSSGNKSFYGHIIRSPWKKSLENHVVQKVY